LLRDAVQNYPAWLHAIERARHTILFEMYIVHEDEQGRHFADALIARAQAGVRVHLLYDWMGGLGKTSRRFWRRLREGGVDVRCFNPPRFDRPLGWISRDHRKTIVVDGQVAFVTGLCVGQVWVGSAARREEPWRDTGIEVRGPAVKDVAIAFAEAWDVAGPPLEDDGTPDVEEMARAGDVGLRVVATVPNTAGILRVDQLVAAMARKRLWLADAYFGGSTAYVQALRAAAVDGVDVRLLVPGASDVPLIRPFSRAGYRPLLDAGVRVFEWNGTMMHAKTALADGQWARVGSTNLNVASWLGNRELDVIVEDADFAHEMEEMFDDDLRHATEIVLTKNRVRVPGSLRRARPELPRRRPGSGGRVVAGAVRVSRTVAAAIINTRVLESVEANIALGAGVLLMAVAVVAAVVPVLVAYPLAALAAWLGVALVYRSVELYRRGRGPVHPFPGDD
jgi:cardiolipin synthase